MLRLFSFLLLFSGIAQCDFEKNFIIASHNEDIEWLKPIANQTIIYNKGNPISEEASNLFAAVVSLPNVGRESHTYLTYVIENYEKLPEVVTFSQARISDHGHLNPLNALITMSEEAKEFGASKNFRQAYVPFHFGFNSVRSDRNYRTVVCEKFSNIGSFMTSFFGSHNPHLKVYWNGIFSVRRDKILSRPKEFYIALRKTLEYHNNPVEGHYFERCWYYIFNVEN